MRLLYWFPLLALPALAQECVYTVSPTSFSVPAAETGGIVRTLRIDVSRGGCAWTARSNVSWITVSFGQSGTNDGTVGIRVDDNREALTRLGTLTIAGQTIPVTQAAANCNFTIFPTSAVVGASGGTGSFEVRTACSWQAVTNTEWITVVTPENGRGAGTGAVGYSVRANTTGATRTGSIEVGPLRFNIQQPAASCTQSLTPAQVSLSAAGGNGSFAVASGCAWTASASASWIQLTGATSGDGNGTVAYTVQANAQAAARSGNIRVGSQTFTVNQAGSGCAVVLSPTSASLPAAGGSGTIAVAATCTWTASTNENWLRLTTSASTVNFTAEPNNSGAARIGAIAIGAQSFTVTQAAGGCAVTVSPASVQIGIAGGSGSLLVSAANGCRWTASPSAAWLTLNPSSGDGGATVFYNASANTGPARTAAITVNAQSVTVTQAGSSPSFTAAGVRHAASFVSGPLAPGLIVTIFGNSLGPADLTVATLIAANAFPTEIAGTRVLFDGVAAPLLYVSANQLSTVVPFAVRGSTRIEVEARGARSSPVMLPVSLTAPGIFTQSAQGSGPGAILNQNFTVNGPSSPAAPGSFVFVFATGGGAMQPAVRDGSLAPGAAGVLVPFAAEIDGAAAVVDYAGAAPGLIAGVLQMNVRVPFDARIGELPLVIRVDEAASQPGVTVSVR
ncbi:MAG: hypothetical protein FJW31_23250 [Acidobacteria bacterium]|nr:hypothetical protein [Acidobacteriota bacterium]